MLMLNFSWRYRCLHKDDQTWRKGWGFIDNCLTFLSGWYANGINQNQMFQNNLIQSNTKQIKTPNNPQMLGLKLLDEPSAQQTDPSVLELHLRWKFKNKGIRCTTLTKPIVDTISSSGWSPRNLLQGWPRFGKFVGGKNIAQLKNYLSNH